MHLDLLLFSVIDSGMNRKLIAAEEDLLAELQKSGALGLSIHEIIALESKGHADAELRAAIWTLQADGGAVLDVDSKLKMPKL